LTEGGLGGRRCTTVEAQKARLVGASPNVFRKGGRKRRGGNQISKTQEGEEKLEGQPESRVGCDCCLRWSDP